MVPGGLKKGCFIQWCCCCTCLLNVGQQPRPGQLECAACGLLLWRIRTCRHSAQAGRTGVGGGGGDGMGSRHCLASSMGGGYLGAGQHTAQAGHAGAWVEQAGVAAGIALLGAHIGGCSS
jgi:hypothetical protein